MKAAPLLERAARIKATKRLSQADAWIGAAAFPGRRDTGSQRPRVYNPGLPAKGFFRHPLNILSTALISETGGRRDFQSIL